jgi:DNA-directed RNA polymerase subunit RPC12/RpoP
MAGKRYAFKCWKCRREYTLFKEITDKQALIVQCPFCGEEGTVNTSQYKVKVTARGENDGHYILKFPSVIPTEKPE